MKDFSQLLPIFRNLGLEVIVENGSVLISPETRELCIKAVEISIDKQCPIVVGNGTLESGLRITLEKLDGFSLDEDSLWVFAEAGLSLGTLESKLNQRGFTLGPFSGELWDHTIGGAISSRSYWRLGKFFSYWEDPLLSVEALLPNAKLFSSTPTPRSATGPDLSKLLSGAEGTLGIILSARLRVFRKNTTPIESAWSFSSFSEAAYAARKILMTGVSPNFLYATETDSETFLIARWQDTPVSIQNTRQVLANTILGDPITNTLPYLETHLKPAKQDAKPIPQILLSYQKLDEFRKRLEDEASLFSSHLFFHESIVLCATQTFAIPFYNSALEIGGIPAPASPLYELGEEFGPRMLGNAFFATQSLKKALDTMHLFAPQALGLASNTNKMIEKNI